MRDKLKLSQEQAQAILKLLDLAWADVDCMIGEDREDKGMTHRWEFAARNGTYKVAQIAQGVKGKPRGKAFQNGQDRRRYHEE